MPQIRQVVSEQLQATIRRLLPSQQGFTEDLQASNVITPIIDLTPSAEGAGLETGLQRAIAFGSQTAFSQVGAGTTVIVNTTGFWRVIGTANNDTANANHTVTLSMSDGISTKTVWQTGNLNNVNTGTSYSVPFDLIFFLDAGESLSCSASTNNYTAIMGSVRQIADIDGNLVNPSGYTAS